MTACIDERRKATEAKIADIMFSLKPILVVENMYGIWRFIRLEERSWKKNIYGVFITIANIVILVIFNVMNKDRTIRDMVYQIPCIGIIVQFTYTMIFKTIIFNKANQEMFTTLADLDCRLCTNTEFYQRGSKKTKKWLSILLVIHVLCSILDLATHGILDAKNIVFLLMLLVQKVEILLFCLVIEMLSSRLALINDVIRKFLSDKEKINPIFKINDTDEISNLDTLGRVSESNMKIRDLAMMYDTIGSICSMANNVFNFPVFMTLLSTFCYIIITIWMFIYYSKIAEHQNYGVIITIIVWCVTALLMVTTMCFACERLLSMRNSTKILVNQLIMDYSLPKTMRVQAKAFMELIEAWPLRIFIYDMFSVDISLMLKFISVSTTYLIVIVQVSHFV